MKKKNKNALEWEKILNVTVVTYYLRIMIIILVRK